MKNSLKIVLSLAGLALAVLPALRADEPSTPPPPAGGQPGGRRGDMHERLQRMITELNLTPDQQAKAQAIIQQSMQSLKTLHEDTTLTDDQKRSQMHDIRKSAEQQIHALLTPEQQAKAKELRQAHRQQQGGQTPPATPTPTPPPAT